MLNKEPTPSEYFDKFWNKEELPKLETIIKEDQMIEVVRLASQTAYLQGYLDGIDRTEKTLLGKQL